MANQDTVQLYYDYGVEGTAANLHPVIYTARNHRAATEVKLGAFAWLNENQLWANTGTGAPDAFLERKQSQAIYALMDIASMIVPVGGEFIGGIIRAEGVYAKITNDSTPAIGNKVFASTTGDYGIAAGAAGATIAGFVETSFEILWVTDNDNKLILMGNFDKGATDIEALAARVTALESA